MECVVTKGKPLSERHQRALDYAIEMIRQSEFADYVTDLYLFGSCARGAAKWASNLNLLLELNQEAKTVSHLSINIHKLMGIISEDSLDSVETVLCVMLGDEWRDSPMLFFRNIRRDGISVWQ